MNTKRKTPILLVEDNPGDVKLVEIELANAAMRCDLFVARSFMEIDDVLLDHTIDLVLLDLTLPDSTGFRTITSFVEKYPEYPVIVLTGNSNEIIGNQSVRAGAQDFLVKGQFDGKQLGRSIRYALQRHAVQLELQRTTQDLERSKQRYAEAQKIAKFGNWEMDLVTNEMTWAPPVYTIFGLRQGHGTDRETYMRHVHSEDRDRVEEFFAEASRDGQTHKIEHRLVVDNKQVRWVGVHAAVSYNSITERVTLLGGMQDITERKLSEQLLIEKNLSGRAESIREDNLQSLGFEVRTPLSTITSMLYLLEQSELDLQQRSYMNDLKLSVDDLGIAINNLLNFSLLASDELEVSRDGIEPVKFLQGIGRVLQLRAEKERIELDIQLDPSLPERLFSDSNKLTQIYYNLLDRAVNDSPIDSTVTAGARLTQSKNGKAELAIYVRDAGAGRSPEEIKKLQQSENLLHEYDPDDDQSFGIAIVAKLTHTLGGRLRIENHREGTDFEVFIPVELPPHAVFSTNTKPESPLRILLVEDHVLNQLGTKKILTSWSGLVSVEIADNGRIGVDRYQEERFDLILMDLQMPVMDGLTASRKIREFSGVPIIALTANGSRQEEDRCYEAGMNDYLQKPFKPADLFAKIMKLTTLVTN